MGKFNPKELSKLGYTDNVAKSIAIEIINKHCKHYTKEQITGLLQHVIQKPEAFRSNEIWGKLVDVMLPHKKETYNYKLHEDPLFHQIYGIKISTNWQDSRWQRPCDCQWQLRVH